MINTPRGLVLASALCTAIAGMSAAQDSETPADVNADTVVASVGDEEITIGHLIALRLTLSQQNLQLPDNVLFEGLLERAIQQRAVAQSAETIEKGTELTLENERFVITSGRVIDAIAGSIAVTDEEIQEAYDAEFAEFAPEKEFNASHILVETEEEANALIQELEGGADFAELAREKSTGPSGPNGGELGWFGTGMMVAPFEAAVVEMEVGAVSAPVETQFGWHVIKLNDTRLPEAPTLESVRDRLASGIWEARVRERVTEIIDGAGVERSEILDSIDPAILRDTSLIDY